MADPTTDPAAGDEPESNLAPGWYRVRRTVNFRNVILTGALLGFVIGALVSIAGPQSPRAGEGAALLFIGLVGALIGSLLASVAAVILDRRS